MKKLREEFADTMLEIGPGDPRLVVVRHRRLKVYGETRRPASLSRRPSGQSTASRSAGGALPGALDVGGDRDQGPPRL